jgi:hypothetical protein
VLLRPIIEILKRAFADEVRLFEMHVGIDGSAVSQQDLVRCIGGARAEWDAADPIAPWGCRVIQ